MSWTDPRDEKVYRTVEIGGFTWLAENLKFKHPNSVSYHFNASYEKQFGRLYDWTSALESCPEGWRLPIEEDFRLLLCLTEERASAMIDPRWMSSSEFSSQVSSQEVNKLGFSALLGGAKLMAGFSNMNFDGYWWSATDVCPDRALRLKIGHDLSLNFNSQAKENSYSVRLVKEI
jgi:uncharacterized protein (TIGR02145 family)